MNGRDVGGSRLMPGLRPKKGKEQRDEDLVLFREMIKQQERARTVNLLGPDSVEFESNGNYQFFRQSSGRKGSGFLTDSAKNDYDWLKTPPATPLFPSLEMESGINAPEFVVQREIPIIQPMLRLSGNSSSATKSKSPKPKPIPENLLAVPNVNLRPIKTSVIPHEPKPISNKFKNTTTSITQKISSQMSTTSKRISTIGTTSKVSTKSITQQQQQQNKLESQNQNFLTSNLSKNKQNEISESKKSKSRRASPLVRSNLNLVDFSNETPPNLKTDRSLSTTCERSVNKTHKSETTPLKRENKNMKTQTRSASVSSIRSLELNKESEKLKTTVVGGNRTQILGSRMVDRLMNARKSSIKTATTRTSEEREIRMKPINMCASLNEELGFGRRVTKSSLDRASKHMKRLISPF